MIEKEIITSRKKIRIRRALILGNFYDKEVKVVMANVFGGETFVDTIIGITTDSLLTKQGRTVPISRIQTIYQL